jgi:hypothetical protein
MASERSKRVTAIAVVVVLAIAVLATMVMLAWGPETVTAPIVH